MGIQMNTHGYIPPNIQPERTIRLSNCHISKIFLTNTCLYLVDRQVYNRQAHGGSYSLKTIDFWMGKYYTRESDAYVHKTFDGRIQFMTFKDNLALDIQPS